MSVELVSGHTSQLLRYCDEILDINSLKEAIFILALGFREFGPGPFGPVFLVDRNQGSRRKPREV